MSRAEVLAVAADYLSDAVNGLEGAVRVLADAEVPGAADQARGLHERAGVLRTEIRGAARAAHRAERPEFYDTSGRWVGRRTETN